MKRLLVLLAFFVLVTPAVAQAQAIPISTDYCDYSLRGGGTLAPDNDVKRIWDLIESGGEPGYGPVDIVSSSVIDHYYTNPLQLFMLYRFRGSYGELRSAWFECWRDGFVPTGTYHDAFYNWGPSS